jgi:hypothetical protein
LEINIENTIWIVSVGSLEDIIEEHVWLGVVNTIRIVSAYILEDIIEGRVWLGVSTTICPTHGEFDKDK